MTVLTVMAMPLDDDGYLGGKYDYSRLPEEIRIQAMTAEGVVVQGLRSAVERVVEAGKALMWAKRVFPHGEYLPWVQACGLKPPYAARLVKAAEWVSNVAGMPHLEGCGIETLFVLSADTTTDEVREWFMERCAAGKVPSRKEVQDRKRSEGQPRQLQHAEDLAINLIRKGQLEQIREALALAERAQVVSAQQVMDEQRLRDLGKQRFIAGCEADFHRMKDGTWIRMPHSGRIDLLAVSKPNPVVPAFAKTDPDSTPAFDMNVGLMSIERAAEILGMPKHALSCRLVPTAVEKRGVFTKNGYSVVRASKGMVRLEKI